MKRMTNAQKVLRLQETLRHRPMDGEWHQVVELLADILHWCDIEAMHCGDLEGERTNIAVRVLAEANASYKRHHCVYCHDETDDPILATVCEGHKHHAEAKMRSPDASGLQRAVPPQDDGDEQVRSEILDLLGL